MYKYYKASIALKFNIFIVIFLFFNSFYCFFNLKKTKIHIGLNLNIIFGIVFLIFALPSIINIFKYLSLPKEILIISDTEIIIYQRKKIIKISPNDLISATKINNFGEQLGFNIGSIKLLLKNKEKAIIISFVGNVKEAYETLEMYVFNNVNKNLSLINKKS